MSALMFESNENLLSFYKYDAMNELVKVLGRKSGLMSVSDKDAVIRVIDKWHLMGEDGLSTKEWDCVLLESIALGEDIIFYVL